MKLNRLKIANCSRVADIDIEVRDNMVLIGPNGSGKTTVLLCLDMLFGMSNQRLYGVLSEGFIRDESQPLIVEAVLGNLDDDELAAFPDEVDVLNGNELVVRLEAELFTFLDPELTAEGPLPSTNNRLEGGINAQIRNVLRDHRGMSSMRRAKAAFWWCYMHSEYPLPAAEILKVMPTDEDIVEVYRRSVYEPQKRDGPAEWGDGVVWTELHHATEWRIDWD